MDNEERIKVTFHPDDKTSYSYWLPDVVSTTQDGLNKDLQEHSSRYLWFSSLHARLVARRDWISSELKNLMASVELTIRKYAEETTRKTTEASVKALVDSDPEVQMARKDLSEADAEVSMCATIKDAFYHRKDCLVALAANYRTEMNILNKESV